MINKQFDIDSDYFSNFFSFLLKGLNFSILFYVIMSSVIYIIIHFYGITIIRDKSQWIEYDQLLYIAILNDFSLLVLIFLGFFTIKKKSKYLFRYILVSPHLDIIESSGTNRRQYFLSES